MTKISNQYSLTNILTADLANSRLGINNVSPTVALDVTGAGKFSSSVTATSGSTLFKEGYIIQATTTSGGGSQPAYTYYTAAGSKRWSHFLDVGSDKFNIANASNAEVFTITQAGAVTFQSANAKTNTGNWHQTISDLTSMASGVGGGISFTGYKTGTSAQGLYAAIDGFKENATSANELGGFRIWTSNGTNLVERMRIASTGNVGIGNTAFANTRVTITGISTTSSNYGLVVNNSSNSNLFTVRDDGLVTAPTINASTISASGTLSSAALSTSQVLYAANLTTFNYAGSLALTVPNALNSGSVLADIRMYMIWATGFGDASHAGARIWLMIMNGNGTAYSATELLGRDTDGGTGLSISRSAVNQITISSNGYGFIKSVSCMQLITN